MVWGRKVECGRHFCSMVDGVRVRCEGVRCVAADSVVVMGVGLMWVSCTYSSVVEYTWISYCEVMT